MAERQIQIQRKRKTGRGFSDLFSVSNFSFITVIIIIIANMYIRIVEETYGFLLTDFFGIIALFLSFIFVNPRILRSNTHEYLRPRLSLTLYQLYISLTKLSGHRSFKKVSSSLLIILAIFFTILSAVISTLWYNGDFSAPVFLFLALFLIKRIITKNLAGNLQGLIVLAWIALIAFGINSIMSGIWYTQIDMNLAFISVLSFDLYSFMAHSEIFLPNTSGQ